MIVQSTIIVNLFFGAGGTLLGAVLYVLYHYPTDDNVPPQPTIEGKLCL